MVATPAKTPAETLTNGVATGDRISVALLEIKRRLMEELPPLIAHANETRDLTGLLSIAPFKAVEIVPKDLTDQHMGKLLVGEDEESVETQGSRGFRSIGIVSLYLINEAWRIEEQYLSALDRASLIKLLMHNYLTDCIDPQGRKVWSELVPLPRKQLPEKWRNYAGLTLPFQVLQSPGNDPWAV